MEKALQLEIVTPDKVVLSNNSVDYVSIPGAEGEFGILPGHIPFLAAVGIGALRYTVGKDTHYISVIGGFAEIADNKVRVLADAAESAEEIDPKRAEEARKRAIERLELSHKQETVDIMRAEAALHRAINRLNIYSKVR